MQQSAKFIVKQLLQNKAYRYPTC